MQGKQIKTYIDKIKKTTFIVGSSFRIFRQLWFDSIWNFAVKVKTNDFRLIQIDIVFKYVLVGLNCGLSSKI